MAVVSTAAADTVDLTVSGWGPRHFPSSIPPPSGAPCICTSGWLGDTIELMGQAGTFDLAPGTYELRIGEVCWTIECTYGGDPWQNLCFDLTLTRTITVGPATVDLVQTGLLTCTYDNDYIVIYEGPQVVVQVGGHDVYIPPLGLGPVAGILNGNAPWTQPCYDLVAEFLVEPSVPVEQGSWGSVKALYR
jgi:hypothetical protein